MSDPYSACEGLLTLIEGILGPDRIDQLRDQLVAELGPDVALPAMRIIRPHLERLRDAQTEEWRSLRREVRADIDGAARVRALHHPSSYPNPDGPGEITYCVGCAEGDGSSPCPTITTLNQPDGAP